MNENEGQEQSGLSRRDIIRRGAVVGGALVWATPVVQSLASPAFAAGTGGGQIGGGPCVNFFQLKLNTGPDGFFGPVVEDAWANPNGQSCFVPRVAGVTYTRPGVTFSTDLKVAFVTIKPGEVLTITLTSESCASLVFPAGCKIESLSLKSGSELGFCETITARTFCTAGSTNGVGDAISNIALVFCCN